MYYNKNLIKIILIVLFFSISIFGCYTVRFYHDTDKLREHPDGEISSKSSLFNIFQENNPPQIRSACPSGASLVEIEQTISDGLYNYFSLGFLNPQSIKVWCKRRKR